MLTEYLSFLRYRARAPQADYSYKEMAQLYAESAEEDREWAEMGIDDYRRGLVEQDQL